RDGMVLIMAMQRVSILLIPRSHKWVQVVEHFWIGFVSDTTCYIAEFGHLFDSLCQPTTEPRPGSTPKVPAWQGEAAGGTHVPKVPYKPPAQKEEDAMWEEDWLKVPDFSETGLKQLEQQWYEAAGVSWPPAKPEEQEAKPGKGDKTKRKTVRGGSRVIRLFRIAHHWCTCDKCQRNKATNQLPPGLLQPLFLPSRNRQQVSMDFIGPLPTTPRGHTMIFTIVDKLNKMIHTHDKQGPVAIGPTIAHWKEESDAMRLEADSGRDSSRSRDFKPNLHLIPTTTTATAHDTARLLFDHIIKHHGLPEAIISDRDPKFTSDFWTSLFHHTGTRLLLSSAYHPLTDGEIEQANRTVEDMLWPYVNDHKADWDQHLAAVEFAYISSEHAGPAFTPFHLNYGQHPTTPSALLLPPPTLVPNQAAEDFNAVKSAKLQPRFVGPFKVLAKHSPVSFKLDLPSSMHILPTFHISRVRPYLSSSSFPERAVELQPSPVIIDGEAYFTVEAILGRRWIDAQHAFQYLIKWAGYGDS
ncbi:hypothetical protein QJQ45_016503, partial [Haematococcus lacustris]